MNSTPNDPFVSGDRAALHESRGFAGDPRSSRQRDQVNRSPEETTVSAGRSSPPPRHTSEWGKWMVERREQRRAERRANGDVTGALNERTSMAGQAGEGGFGLTLQSAAERELERILRDPHARDADKIAAARVLAGMERDGGPVDLHPDIAALDAMSLSELCALYARLAE